MSKINSIWFIYLIRTDKGSLYTGITTDVDRRFKEHDASGIRAAKFLKGKGPLTLAFFTEVGGRSHALKLEYRVKRLTKRKKEQIIFGSITLPDLFPELFKVAI
jgi:putative endonuclease